jgi:multicomponent Na+:H+ antiporter subunit D
MSSEQLLPLLVAVPLALAVVVAAAGTHLPRRVLDSAVTAALVAFATAAGVLVHTAGQRRIVSPLGGWRPHHGVSLGIVLVADRAAAGLLLVVAVLGVAAFVFTWRYFDEVDGVFAALLLGFLAGMSGFVLSGDLFTMFVFFEVMSVAAFALTAHRTEEPESMQGAIGFGLVNSLAAYGALMGIALLYARTGALNLAQLGTTLGGRRPDALVLVGGAMVTVGWLVKAALVPFHFWLADAHAAAPAPVCVLFSGIMVPLGLYGAVRVQVVVLGNAIGSPPLSHVLLYGGALTAVVGAAMCVQQLHVKRMLALSTVSHVGLFAIGASALSADGVGGAGIYVAGHACIKGALFLIGGVLLNGYGSLSEHDLHGRARDSRLLGAVWLLCGLALAGLPPFGTWSGKSLVDDAAIARGAGWVVPLAVITSAVTGATVLRAGLRIFVGLGRPAPAHEGNEEQGDEETTDTERTVPTPAPWTMHAPVLGLVGIALWLGTWSPAHAYALRAGAGLLDGAGYRTQVLAGRGGSAALSVHVPSVTARSVATGLVGVALAGLLAVAMLLWTRRNAVTDAVRRVGKAIAAVHTGHVGDEIAWLVTGLAAVVTTYLALQ